MSALSYTDFSLRLRDRLWGKRVPTNGTIELTRQCPLRCVHCYNRLPLGDPESLRKELDLEAHCKILDQISAAGCLWLLYTGGEIFARKDFIEIYTYARQKGLLITLFTNGILIDDRVADHLAARRPFSIEITLYGRSRETHERVTGVAGSYDRCLEGVRRLRERNLPLKLKAMVMTINKAELGEMKRFAEEEMGVEFRFDAMINPRLDRTKSPLAVRLSPREVVELDLLDSRRVEEWRRLAKGFHLSAAARNPDELYTCGGGESDFAIDPYGRMSLCALSSSGKWDLGGGSFRDGWENFLVPLRRGRITKKTKCAACRLKALCGMCPVNGELENGDAEAPVDFLCEVAHLRAYALGLPVPPHEGCEYCAGGKRHGQLLAAIAALKPAAARGPSPGPRFKREDRFCSHPGAGGPT